MYTVYCLYIHIYYLCLYYLNYTFYMNHLKIVNVYTYIHKDTRTHAYIQTYTHTHTHTCIYNVLLHSQKYILHHPQLSTYFQYNLCELGCSLESLSSWFRTGLEGNSAGRLMSRGRIRQL